jgi:hypothetical protein
MMERPGRALVICAGALERVETINVKASRRGQEFLFIS